MARYAIKKINNRYAVLRVQKFLFWESRDFLNFANVETAASMIFWSSSTLFNLKDNTKPTLEEAANVLIDVLSLDYDDMSEIRNKINFGLED